jgi:hypothetical protein
MGYTNICPFCGASKFVKEASKIYMEIRFTDTHKDRINYGIDHGTDILCKCDICKAELCVWSSYANYNTDALNVHLEQSEDIRLAIEAIKSGAKAPVSLSFNHCSEITVEQW